MATDTKLVRPLLDFGSTIADHTGDLKGDISMLRYLSAADASKLLNLTPGGVRLMARRGELPVAAVTEGGIQLFTREDVERVANTRTSKTRVARGQKVE